MVSAYPAFEALNDSVLEMRSESNSPTPTPLVLVCNDEDAPLIVRVTVASGSRLLVLRFLTITLTLPLMGESLSDFSRSDILARSKSEASRVSLRYPSFDATHFTLPH